MKTKNNFISLCTLVLLASAILFSCGGTKAIVDQTPSKTNDFAFDFVESDKLQSVLDLAAEQGKLVFLDVYTTWCLPCKMMEKDVFTNESTAAIINEDFISYKVDAEKANGLNVAFQYNVSQYPTILFLDPAGNVLEREEGAVYHSKLISMADNALAKVKVSE